ncbi:MAG: peptide-methionine (S)-S-oxide reductase MsrA [Campylobacterota bacterium]|nr:peptide-methionine (S)-S-oxide reductase MsrA [Campylobacterota bacterium]
MAKRELVLGGGCFWCLEAVFELLNGVEDVVSGYANGAMENPDYHSVCSGETGHAEVIKISYDDKIISSDDILRIFFDIHNPTTLNSQGADIGTQYRSVILYEDSDTKERAIRAKDEAQLNYRESIVTLIEPLEKFYLAEPYHQDYYRLNRTQGYCMAVITPKVERVKKRYETKIF